MEDRNKRPTKIGKPIQVRLQPDALSAVDRFIKKQAEPMTRPQAIRAILMDWLKMKGVIK